MDDEPTPITSVVNVLSREGRDNFFFFDAEGKEVDPDIEFFDYDQVDEFNAKYGMNAIITD